MTDIRAFFCQHGLRCTKQRQGIYRTLAATDTHPTADELYWLAVESDENLSLATVYNTLEVFCEHGICRRLATNTGPTRFDADLSGHLHVQDANGVIRDVPHELGQRVLDAIGPELLHEIGARLGVEIDGARIELSGKPVGHKASPSNL